MMMIISRGHLQQSFFHQAICGTRDYYYCYYSVPQVGRRKVASLGYHEEGERWWVEKGELQVMMDDDDDDR